jgi:hypothetical protein
LVWPRDSFGRRFLYLRASAVDFSRKIADFSLE